MNPDNPYAAPQTVELRATSELPVAEVWGRNLFPELDTQQLRRLADYSHTMQLMTRLWFIPLGISCLLMSNVDSLPVTAKVILFLIVPMIGLRIVGGQTRGRFMRYYTAFLDALLALGLLLGIVAGFVTMPSGGSLLLFVPATIVMGFLAIIGFTSFMAHRFAPELFGSQRYLHRELTQEVDYRQQHGIG